jgi:hypothetical protein
LVSSGAEISFINNWTDYICCKNGLKTPLSEIFENCTMAIVYGTLLTNWTRT